MIKAWMKREVFLFSAPGDTNVVPGDIIEVDPKAVLGFIAKNYEEDSNNYDTKAVLVRRSGSIIRYQVTKVVPRQSGGFDIFGRYETITVLKD